MSPGTSSYISMYTNAVANSFRVQLYSEHEFYDIIFKIKRRLYIASGPAPFPLYGKTLGAHLHSANKNCAQYKASVLLRMGIFSVLPTAALRHHTRLDIAT